MRGGASIAYCMSVTQKPQGESTVYRSPKSKGRLFGRPQPKLAILKDFVLNSAKRYADNEALGIIVIKNSQATVQFITDKEFLCFRTTLQRGHVESYQKMICITEIYLRHNFIKNDNLAFVLVNQFIFSICKKELLRKMKAFRNSYIFEGKVNSNYIFSICRRIMKLVQKSKSNRVLPYQRSQTVKPGRQYLKQLQNEVSKSRIAIENMNHTQAIQNTLYNKVQQLQKELHYCILNINHEQEKEKILKELNLILKSEMNQVQAAQRTKDELMSSSYEKKIKKVEYDIKQILHKINQEVAKINWLKEQANSARDQRVVYSNLFNKIQKEIKHYEELYKQNLIKNQLFLDQKRGGGFLNISSLQLPLIQNDAIEQYNQTKIGLSDLIQKQPKSTYSVGLSKKEVKVRDTKKSNLKSQHPNDLDLFITNLQTAQNKEAYRIDINSATSRNQYFCGLDKESLIAKKQAFIEKVVVMAQCRSYQEVIHVYGSQQRQNQFLATQIIQMDELISDLQEQIQRKRRHKGDSELDFIRKLQEKAKTYKKFKTQQSSRESNKQVPSQPMTQITQQICQILGVQLQNLGDDVLREMDRKIDDLGCSIIIDKKSRRDSKVVSIKEIYGCEKGFCQLIEKIDRFGQCEKIYDQKMLREEYQKELNKIKKKGKKGY